MIEAREWIMPDDEEVPMPPDGYVISSCHSTSMGMRFLPTNSSGGYCTTMTSSYNT
jgi:hypothetical protein